MRSHLAHAARPIQRECAPIAGSDIEKMLLARVEQLERHLSDAMEWLEELSNDMVDQVYSAKR